MSPESPRNSEDPRVIAKVDGSGFPYDQVFGDYPATTELPATPRPPRKLHRTGHVRDTEGRPDEFRGGMSAPVSDEAIAAMKAALPQIRHARDVRKWNELQSQKNRGELTTAELAAKWRAYLERKK